jgi:hypothetical protein
MTENMFTKKMQGNKLPVPVYSVSSPEDDTVLLAMDVKIKHGFISWFDSTKERVMGIENIEEKPNGELIFHSKADEGNREYTFTPLTLDIYKKHVQKKLLAGKDFDNEEDMLKAIESTKKNAW